MAACASRRAAYADAATVDKPRRAAEHETTSPQTEERTESGSAYAELR
jgi:hypothetical protein